MRRPIGGRIAATMLGAVLLVPGFGAAALQEREDLAYGKPATASTFQDDDKFPGAAVDGDPETRWCASDGSAPQWLQVDLEKPETLTGYRIVWEHDDAPYRYKVEGSADGKAWKLLSDQSRSTERAQVRTQALQARNIRYVRLTATRLDPADWASVFSFQVFGTRPAPPEALTRARKDDGSSILRDVKAPDGFEVTVFAAPPDVRYPTCLAAAPNGEVFVGVDENGSLDAKSGRGRVVRCVDTDDDGKADQFNDFATMDSPRGVVWDAGTLYVLHPPELTAYHDDDGDGTSDRSEALIKGIGFDLNFRGADHTTNGIRLGIDGYLYIAVGDYGFIKAEGKDGTSLQLLGGGVARVRTDGSGLEIVSRGQRNIYDVAIDPYMDLFTRDNTNDGDGWDVRLSHVVPTAHYGYPSLFKRFPEEHLPPLADYGGGSPCGSLYLQEPGLPKEFGDTLYTCEWGRGGIFRHPLERSGAGFKAGQEMFVPMSRPTDMDVDGRGRIFISSWKDGGFNYSKANVGYVVRLKYKDNNTPAFPDLKALTGQELFQGLVAPSAVLRLAAQRELLRRDTSLMSFTRSMLLLAGDASKPLPGRVAAVFTLGLKNGSGSAPFLELAKSTPDLRAFAIKALADMRSADPKADARAISAYLDDPDPRARLQAVIALGRLGQPESAESILPRTADPDPIVAHASIKALVALNAGEACLKALSDPKLAPGASMALQAMHDPDVVSGLIRLIEDSKGSEARKPALKALCRLYFREAPYEGKWWGTRPDTSGPYYNPVTWEGSEAIGKALRSALKQSDEATARWLLAELLKNKVDFEETTALALKLAGQDPALRSSTIDLMSARKDLTFDAIKFLEKVATGDAEPSVRARAIRSLLRHAKQQEARESALRALAPIGLQEEPAPELEAAWLEYARDGRQLRDPAIAIRLAQGSDPGKGVLGYGLLLQLDDNAKAPEAARLEARKAIDRGWERPEAAARLLRAIGLTKAERFAPRIEPFLGGNRMETRKAAQFAARKLDIGPKSPGEPRPMGKPIAATPIEQILAVVLKEKGDASAGAQLFEKQGCVNCHSVTKGQPIKGPYLGDITTRYNRAELTESILKPSAKIAQGFETQKIALNSGLIYEGFVVRESGEELEMRNSAGAVTIIPKAEIEERGKSEVSVMPQGLLDPLTPEDLASILAYLESLKGT
ncbi:DUF7133 domain-containing protein [Tundrisphaera lichenicola]|uniref:DUF7133 domain-containing protein n=1 Tax=Tundrisphaera lichenicola TaxID=2029860 RepID=UPI003EBF5442